MRSFFASLLAMAAIAPASPAAACGGFFCSQSTGGQPVDQAGEDIVYVVPGDGTLTMIVRIVYQGASENFAWILPIPIAPSAIELGPDALFTQLAASTGPRFQTTQRTEGTCRTGPDCVYPSPGCSIGCAQYGPAYSVSSDAGVASDASRGVMVVAEQTVGAYETVVLSGGTADELHTWLSDHGYDLPPSSIPLIADYVAARQLFVALRLRAASSSDAIQPIMLTMAHEQPCLPIRLTAIATVPGLPIRAYFLGDAPYVPTNFSLLDPPYSVGVFNGGTPWATQWSDAIDEAGGHAFVRDYAGDPVGVALQLAALDRLRTAEPGAFLTQAIGVERYPREALIAIAPDHVTLDAGIDVADWVDGCTMFGTCPIPVSWDPSGFVDALHAQVREPRARLQAAFDRERWLTRLYTTMDADEMTLDPEFRADSGVGAQSNVHQAVQVTECDPSVYAEQAGQRMELPDGSSARVREPNLELTADEICRSRGATGARSGGCAAVFGRHPALRPALVLAAIALVLAMRRAKA